MNLTLCAAATVECATWCGAEYLRSGSVTRGIVDETEAGRLGLASSNLRRDLP